MALIAPRLLVYRLDPSRAPDGAPGIAIVVSHSVTRVRVRTPSHSTVRTDEDDSIWQCSVRSGSLSMRERPFEGQPPVGFGRFPAQYGLPGEDIDPNPTRSRRRDRIDRGLVR
jgi:hypothetical protein